MCRALPFIYEESEQWDIGETMFYDIVFIRDHGAILKGRQSYAASVDFINGVLMLYDSDNPEPVNTEQTVLRSE